MQVQSRPGRLLNHDQKCNKLPGVLHRNFHRFVCPVVNSYSELDRSAQNRIAALSSFYRLFIDIRVGGIDRVGRIRVNLAGSSAITAEIQRVGVLLSRFPVVVGCG